ncbi:Uu.00g134700.m01.CDS01 [Anthostomella pinea]|uniref:Uu.00g134700.m01.CDS01 n=1 Tax=Anthostomella pinea TaxID=933095 RepID=A0AAI8VP25_9PEZI|nr:Uu.00g134700.m01.CDS01 [Anthostomella pinea]
MGNASEALGEPIAFAPPVGTAAVVLARRVHVQPASGALTLGSSCLYLSQKGFLEADPYLDRVKRLIMCQRGEPIAIIGSACHFAGGSNSPSKLWELLTNPSDVRTEVPDSRFSVRGFYHHDPAQNGHTNVRHSYLLEDDLSAFDAEFFGIKPVEAKAVDPQQRWLLETVYEVSIFHGIEAAGLTIESLRGSDTGVYVGVMCGDYGSILLRDLEATPTYSATGTANSIMSNRISHFFDWRGPSITLDTACSSSLVAVHLAIQALRTGESRIAVACGSNLILGPESYIIESKLKMLSPDGVCRMWDQDANGYARGDGVAAIILKTLKEALADGDHIECVIRETGINQDGNTPGITIPSASSQAALIRQTYAKAGLSPFLKQGDGPQYFEAHGTGTLAGDPIEAEAIRAAFFGGKEEVHGPRQHTADAENRHLLYVGSVKTVLGHTEGTAGLAGILKASLALQHALIPPNLHFRHLSGRVAPFYSNLELVQGETKPWPAIAGSGEHHRRASVNSFGFGGTNAHAILEHFNNSVTSSPTHLDRLFTPIVFSESSEHSLRASLTEYAEFLNRNPTIEMHDLAWTLRQRRSLLAHRVYYPAQSIPELRQQIIATLHKGEESLVGYRFSRDSNKGKLLGIFTGQGAQFARVGAELVEHSPRAQNIIRSLEEHLAALDPSDRPTWSLQAEMLASGDSSRIHQAAIAQPVCTAVQILLVDLLALAGVHFDIVIGHSSGEICAAYAAGALSARDALYIAYFRGLYTARAASPNGENIRGAMVAVQTSMEDAMELCQDEVYRGRIEVAAINSSSSVTISGDVDAIAELEELLRDENTGFRRLRVDTAYHSRYMDRCCAPYIESLRRYGVQTEKHRPHTNCKWYSTVYNRLIDIPVDGDSGLSVTYWADNMKQPVLLSHALRTSLTVGDGAIPSVILEVGPHPALQGPISQTILESLETTIPYHGTLRRGIGSVEALSSSLGFLWQRFYKHHSRAFNLDRFEQAMTITNDEDRQYHCFRLLKGLPSYQWNHSTRYWAESRASRRLRVRPDSFHPLLGHFTPDSSPHHLRWRNLLRATQSYSDDSHDESSWMTEHCIDGQTLVPAAGYVSTATPRCGRDRGLCDCIHDLVIHQAVVLNSDNNDGVEVLIELADIAVTNAGTRVRSHFTFSAALGRSDDTLTLVASAELEVLLGIGAPDQTLLPARPAAIPHMTEVNPELFYMSLVSLGYNYQGRYRSMKSLSRKHGRATGSVTVRESDDETSLLTNPAGLDAAFQSLLLAYSFPNDTQMRSLHLPLRLGHIRVNPVQCGNAFRRLKLPDDAQDVPRHVPRDHSMDVEATVTRSHQSLSTSSGRGGFVGDITIFSSPSAHAAIQIQDIQIVPLGADDQHSDRSVFTKMQLVDMAYDGTAAAAADAGSIESSSAIATRDALKRLAVYYLREYESYVLVDSPLRSSTNNDPMSYFLQYAQHLISSLGPEWRSEDSLSDIKQATNVIPMLPDVRVMTLVGESIPRIVRGETTMLEQFRESGVLDRFYEEGFATAPSARWQTRIVKQLADRNPHLDIIEVGAGTGGTTKPILRSIGSSFRSYTFTDVSAGFFGTASAALSSFKDRIVFKTLDLETDPCSQGIPAGAYDVVVASFVLHATGSLKSTLAHVRTLLKPGGFLIVGEGSMDSPLLSFIFGPLSGWWLGRGDEGRTLSPAVSAAQWHQLLLEAGFSGIDTRSPVSWEDTLGVCLFASQAVNDQIRMFRAPLTLDIPRAHHTKDVVLIGGRTDLTKPPVKELQSTFQQLGIHVYTYQSLGEVDYDGNLFNQAHPPPVLNISDLDKPVLEDIDEESFLSFRRMLQTGKTILWVTSGRLARSPYSNLVVGFGRAAVQETASLFIQNLDLESPFDRTTPLVIAETFMRFVLCSTSAQETSEEKMLWTVEPEIVISADGHHRVPRLLPLSDVNARYDSGRRSIFQNVNPANLLPTDYDSTRGLITATEHLSEFKVSRAIPPAIKTPLGHRFLALGTMNRMETQQLALVPFMASIVNIRAADMVPVPAHSKGDISLLSALAAWLVALEVTRLLLPGQTILVHDALPRVIKAIRTQAARKGVNVICSANIHSSQGTAAVPNAVDVTLRQFLSRDELRQSLPFRKGISCFAGFATGIDQVKTQDMIIESLPEWCQIKTAESLYAWTGDDTAPVVDATAMDILLEAVDNAEDLECTADDELEMIQLGRLAPEMTGASTGNYVTGSHSDGKPFIIDFTASPEVPAQAHGRNGVSVTIMPCDATTHAALVAVHAQICDNHPPIAGLFNGAMILRDTMMGNMSYSQFTEVLGPKVTGSLNLDRIFSSPETPLEFFILLSSINCTIGNPGQANYAAANAFQCALAASRRQRNLPGVALNVGAIIVAGYLHRTDKRKLDLTVARGGLMHLSEEDFHQIVAEGVFASYTGSETELTTGLLSVAHDAVDRPIWFTDPKFAHLIKSHGEAVDDFGSTPKGGGDRDGNRGRPQVSALQTRLRSSKTRGELEAVVKEALAAQLRYELQMKSISDDELMQMHKGELGIDSLISVDIRNWFLKSMSISIPVLRIMSNETVMSLVHHAIESMPPKMVPQMPQEHISSQTDEQPFQPPADGRTALSYNSDHRSNTSMKAAELQVLVNWDAETLPPTVPDHFSALLRSHPAYTEAAGFPPKRFILSGVTGLLGRNLLSYLLQTTPPTTRIINIAVRQLQTTDLGTFLAGVPPDISGAASTGRTTFLAGDLTQPRLGLSTADCAAVFADADVVIHAGADTSHIKPYAALRAANVGSTTELVRICAARRGVPLHFVSSVGVGLFSAADGSGPDMEELLPARAPGTPPTAHGEAVLAHSGYTASKWVAERLLERASAAAGLRVYIHRPSTIMRQDADAHEERARFDWLNQLVSYACTMRAVPEVRHVSGALDLVYVRSVCEQISQCVLRRPEVEDELVSYVHEVGDVVVPLEKMEKLLELGLPRSFADEQSEGRQESGGNASSTGRDRPATFRRMPMAEWIDMAVAQGMQPAVAALIEAMDQPDTPAFLKLRRGASFDKGGPS